MNHLGARTVIKEIDNLVITRLSDAMLVPEENVVFMRYYYIENDKSGEVINSYQAEQKYRYFTIPEIEYYLENNGLEAISFFTYLKEEKLSDNWNVGCIARANRRRF